MAPPTKKRKITVTVPEKIEFDPTAREEYLTGFHKRKVARQKFAQDEIAKRDKEEKLQFRKELRQQRKVDLEAHVAEVNRLVKQANGDIIGLGNSSSDNSSDDEDDAEDAAPQDPEPINHSDSYIDEDKYTTVSIESVGISRSGFSRAGSHDSLDAEAAAKAAAADAEKLAAEVAKHKKGEVQRDANGKRIWTKERPRTEWPKKKKKKFRYENKADRKVARFKEGAKKRKMKEKRDKKDE